jgi:signal transduction histidine kinase
LQRQPQPTILNVIATPAVIPSIHRSRHGVAAAALAALSALAVALSIIITIRAYSIDGAGEELRSMWIDGVLMILPLGVAGAVLIDRRGDLPFGWLLGAGAAALTLSMVLVAPATFAILEGSTSAWARWALAVGSSLWFVPEVMAGLVNVRFPSGRVSGRGGRALERAIVLSGALTLVGGSLGTSALNSDYPEQTQLPTLEHPLTGGSAVADLADVLVLFAPITVLLGLVAGVGVIVRWRRAAGVERLQLKWRAVGVMIGIALFPVAVVSDPIDYARVGVPFFVLTLVQPVLRHRLWAIDTILRRSAVYGILFVGLLVVFATLSATVAALASEQVGAFVAAVVVAAAFSPLRDRAQRLVDRVFFGSRGDPYQALTGLAAQLITVDPRAVPTTIVDVVQRSLRLGYVGIERQGATIAAAGTMTASVERWPLVFEGTTLGYLVAAPRRGEDCFDGRDRTLLADVAKHAGAAVRAAALTADLVASRERLVTAREEERRRLRRDLHDDLGPLLTAIGLNLDAARSQDDAASADALLGDARAATSSATRDLRRIVEGLRPPTLDELGLVGALRAAAHRLERGSDVTFSIVADDVACLPAAVEVAALRIASEAMHNVVRHSRGGHCSVTLAVQQHALIVQILDDGIEQTRWTPGVGMAAMNERADELGGTLVAGPRPGGGGLVRAELPLAEEPS